MVENKTIPCDGYTIHLTLNDNARWRGDGYAVHATLVRDGTTHHEYVGKTMTEEWEQWAKDAALAVASRPSWPVGFDASDWKDDT